MRKLRYMDEVRRVFAGRDWVLHRDAVARLIELGVPQSTAYDRIRRLSRRPKGQRPRIEVEGDRLSLQDVKGIEKDMYRDEVRECLQVIREAYVPGEAAPGKGAVNPEKKAFYVDRLDELVGKGVTGEGIARTLIAALTADVPADDRVRLARILQRLAASAAEDGDDATLRTIRGALQEREGSVRKDLMGMVADDSEDIEVRCSLIGTMMALGDRRVLEVIELLGPYDDSGDGSRILEQFDALARTYHEREGVMVERYLKGLLDHEEAGVRKRASRLLRHVLK